MNYPQHPLSAAFPAMPRMHLDYLAKDIAEHGLHIAITLFDGMILDGWHRYQACQVAGVSPRFESLSEGADPVAFVRSRNLHRRDLTPSQRAAAVVACSEWAKRGTNQHGGSEPGSHPQTATEMAKAADVSVKTIQQAKAAHIAGLGEQVRDGIITAKAAVKQVRQGAASERTPPASAKPQIKWSVVGPMLKAALEQIRDADDREAAIEMALCLLGEIEKQQIAT
ncbi:hypothetical protein [Desulfuromonas thiophila]|uniref:hypothetical protein n=1 Tax=Desulfuromonas thiophila TaxID=57664 RepID=UPI0029F4C8A9|nr:hypothetical protein [Desulfuromonas thiophila]